MKKLLTTFIAALFLCICANAQFRIDANLSATLFSLKSGSVSESMDAGFGPTFRAFGRIIGNRFVGIDLGLGYAQRKGLANSRISSPDLTLNNIEIPALFYVNLGLGKIFAITPMVGAYADYAVGGSSYFEGKKGLERFNYGAEAELMFTFLSHLTLGGGVQYGLRDLSNTSGVSFKPVSFYLGLGWKF